MKWEFLIARRYISSRRKSLFLSFLTWIAVLGVAIGVASLIVVLSVMGGFQKDLQKKVVGFNAPVVAWWPDETASLVAPATTASAGKRRSSLEKISDIAKSFGGMSEEFVEGEGIARSTDGKVMGVKIRGSGGISNDLINAGTQEGDAGGGPPMTHRTKWSQAPESGAWHHFGSSISGGVRRQDPLGGVYETKVIWAEDIEKRLKKNKNGVVIGVELASQLQVHPDFDEEIDLIYPLGDVGPTGDLLPRVRRFSLLGVFRSGFYQYDTMYVWTTIDGARGILGDGRREGVAFRMDDLKQSKNLREEILKADAGFEKVEIWEEQNRRLFSALKLERIGMFLILSAMVLIATFNVFGLLSIVEMDKLKDMALLRSIGAKTASVRDLFLYQGVYIGSLGAAIGGVLGIAFAIFLKEKRIPLPHAYYVDYMPVDLDIFRIGMVLLVAPLLCLLISYFPSRRASRREPVEALKYE